MKTKLLLALMACMCVVSCKKDSDATNGADDSIYGVWDAVFYYKVDYNCCTFDDVVKHYEGKLTDTVKKSELDNDIDDRYNGKDGHFEMKIIPIDKSNHTAKIKMWNEEYDARIFENTIFIDIKGEIDFEIKYKGGKPTKLYLMSEIFRDDDFEFVHYILCTKVREL